MGIDPSVQQRLFTLAGVVTHPLIDDLTANANRFRGFGLRLVQLQHQEHRANAKGFLRLPAKASKVSRFHETECNGFGLVCHVLYWDISSIESASWRR